RAGHSLAGTYRCVALSRGAPSTRLPEARRAPADREGSRRDTCRATPAWAQPRAIPRPSEMHRSTPTPRESRWRGKSSTPGPGPAGKGPGFPRRRRPWRFPAAFTAFPLALLTASAGSFRVEEEAVQEFQGQRFVDLRRVVAGPLEVTAHH